MLMDKKCLSKIKSGLYTSAHVRVFVVSGSVGGVSYFVGMRGFCVLGSGGGGVAIVLVLTVEVARVVNSCL